MSIYRKAIKAVKRSSKFHVDFEHRNLKIGSDYIVKNGEYKGRFGVRNRKNYLEKIESLYSMYLHSAPSERSENKRRKYFRAPSYDDVIEYDLLYGEDREVAQARLEIYILGLIVRGIFKWDEDTMGTWFWKSKEYPGCVILKKWVVVDSCNNNN